MASSWANYYVHKITIYSMLLGTNVAMAMPLPISLHLSKCLVHALEFEVVKNIHCITALNSMKIQHGLVLVMGSN